MRLLLPLSYPLRMLAYFNRRATGTSLAELRAALASLEMEPHDEAEHGLHFVGWSTEINP